MKYLGSPQSGSRGEITASRNRTGQYYRNRAIPVNPRSNFQGVVRSRMSANSSSWRAITSLQRQGWHSLGSQMSRTDALGQTYTLVGFQAYCSVNQNNVNAGNAVVSDAPAIVTPAGLITATVTLTASAFSIAFTVTPLATGARLFAFCSPQRSAGKAFEGDYRLIAVSAAALASPMVLTTSYAARLGTPVVGNRIFMSLQVCLGGFVSGPLDISQVVA